MVDFTLKTAGGADVTGLNPDSVSGTFVKLVAASAGKRSHWVNYIHGQETGDMPKTCKLGDEAGNLCSVDGDCPGIGGTCTVDSPAVPDDPGARQAERDEGDAEAGNVLDNGDGSYTFTYTADPTTSTDPTWEPNLTHRAGLEIRINNTLNPDNPTFDLVPDGGAGSGHKDILSTDSCNNCHGRLGLHGGGTGGRFTVEYCVTCHNDQSRDQGWGESIDMAHMAHSIHGKVVREFQETEFKEFAYWILGRDPHDYTETTYPRPIIDCATCHTMTEETPDGDAWKTSVDSLSCGGCHVSGLTVSTADATTGLSTYTYTHQIVPEIGQKSDGECVNCHSPTTPPAPPNAISAQEVHRNLVAEAMKNFGLGIEDVLLNGDGDIEITFTVFNPTDDTTYDITDPLGPFGDLECDGGDDDGDPCSDDDDCLGTDPEPNGTCDSRARLRFRIAWSTDDYSNHESLDIVGQPVTINALDECTGLALNCSANLVCDGGANDGETCDPDADCPLGECVLDVCVGGTNDGLACDPDAECPGGTCILDSYTLTDDTITLPSTTTGDTYGVAMEGRARVDVDSNGSANSIPITSQIDYVTIDDVMTPMPRREIVSIELCNNCHGIKTNHGSNRTNNVQVCVVCHNANATDLEDAGPLFEASVDLKVMIHGIHDANASFGDGADPFFHVTYPRHNRSTRECNACHLEGTYYPVDTTVNFRLATTTDSEALPADPEDDLNTTFNAATCGGCHLNLDNPDTAQDESAGSITTAAHMVQNGSSFVIEQDITGMFTNELTVETCILCHGEGGSEDVGVVHGIE